MNSTPLLIGLAGRARSGKDTVAWGLQRHGLVPYSFATPLKRALVSIFEDFGDYETIAGRFFGDVDRNVPFSETIQATPRAMMQTLGTEWGRQMVHTNLWLEIGKMVVERRRTRFTTGYRGTVISDVRFPNEAEWIRSAGGEIWHIQRPAAKAVDIGGVEGHQSEQALEPDLLRDRFIHNVGTLGDLQEQVDFLFKDAVSRRE